MHAKHLHVLLKPLVCLQQVSGRAVGRDDKKKTEATLPVVPADWEFAPPCTTIKDLSYELTLGGGLPGSLKGDGTGDTLAIKLGDGKIALGNSFSADSNSKGTVDLQKTFKKGTVDIRDLKMVAIDDDDSSAGFFDRGWRFQGMHHSESF